MREMYLNQAKTIVNRYIKMRVLLSLQYCIDLQMSFKLYIYIFDSKNYEALF